MPICHKHSFTSTFTSTKQETQLSHRDRATLRVIEYYAKSLKITQGHLK